MFLNANYKNQTFSAILENNVIFVEFGNNYLKFDLKNLSDVIKMLNRQFHLDLPADLISNLFKCANEGNVEGLVGALSSNVVLKFDKNFKFSFKDLSFFENVSSVGDDTIISLNDSVIKFTLINKTLKGLTFSKNGFEFNSQTTDYVEKTISKSENAYIELAELLPTIEKTIEIAKSEKISGKAVVKDDDKLLLTLDFNIFNGEKLCIDAHTTIKNIPIALTYLDGKVYLSVDKNLMILSHCIQVLIYLDTLKLKNL